MGYRRSLTAVATSTAIAIASSPLEILEMPTSASRGSRSLMVLG